MGALRVMNRISTLMQKIIAHEMKWIGNFDFRKVSSMLNYSDRKRGPFIVAYWHERSGQKASRIIVQVYLHQCLGMANVCVGGMEFTSDGKRSLSMSEMTAYY